MPARAAPGALIAADLTAPDLTNAKS